MAPTKSSHKPIMKPPMIDAISIGRALLVAELKSFRAAARLLQVREASVSRRVRALEDELGVSLFERQHGRVRVTNAGTAFFEEARHSLNQLQQAVTRARAAGSGKVGRLSIGVLSSIGIGFLRDLISAYSQQHGEVSLQFDERASPQHIELIRQRRLDVVFTADTSTARDCDTEVLWKERLFVVLPPEHALARQKTVAWRNLHDEHFIIRESDCSPMLCEQVVKNLSDHTHVPHIEKALVERDNLMHLVAMGRGVSLTSEATAVSGFPNVAFRPIGGSGGIVEFSAVWLARNDNPALRRFLSLARTLAKERKKSLAEHATAASQGLAFRGIALPLAFLGGLLRRLGLSP